MKKLNLSIIFILLFSFFTMESFAFSKEEKDKKLAQIRDLKSKGETVYAILPKNTDEPFFKLAGKGCVDRAKELGVNCIFYGSTRENMRYQVDDILDLIEAGVDGISVCVVRDGYIASTISNEIKKWAKPIISFGSPLSPKISMGYIGSDNYLLGKVIGEEVKKLKPEGGKYCIQTERYDSPDHRKRLDGIIDGLTSKDSKWTNVLRCPQQTMGDFELGTRQMETVLKIYKVDAFISTGGGPQFLSKLYRKAMEPFKEKIKSGKLIYANIDTIPVQLEYLKEGISTVNVGQRPYEMGTLSLESLMKLTAGEKLPPAIYTGITICTKQNVGTCTK